MSELTPSARNPTAPASALASRRRREQGSSFLEVTIAIIVSFVVFASYAASVVDAVDTTAYDVGGASLHEIGRRTLDTITRELASSGRFVDPLGIELPHVFANGAPDPILAPDFEHDRQVLETIAGSFPPPPTPPATGGNPPPFVAPGMELTPLALREIVYRLPVDLDGDGRILAAADGTVEWGPELYGFLLVPNASGALDLVRRTVDGSGTVQDEVLCRWVEALTFDTALTKQVLPRDAIEVHLHLRRADTRARMRRLHLSTTIVMRNSP